MILKLSGSNGYRLISGVIDCTFHRTPMPYVVFHRSIKEERIDLVDNAFVMNDEGNTIEKFFIEPRK